jgi:hypothetical protein
LQKRPKMMMMLQTIVMMIKMSQMMARWLRRRKMNLDAIAREIQIVGVGVWSGKEVGIGIEAGAGMETGIGIENAAEIETVTGIETERETGEAGAILIEIEIGTGIEVAMIVVTDGEIAIEIEIVAVEGKIASAEIEMEAVEEAEMRGEDWEDGTMTKRKNAQTRRQLGEKLTTR